MTDLDALLAATKMQQAELRSVFDTSPDAILIMQLAPPRVLRANAAACRHFGAAEELLRAKSAPQFADPSDPRLSELRAAWERGGSVRGEVFLLREDGSRFEAEVSVSTFRSPEGAPCMAFIARDITARRRAEAEVRDAHRFVDSIVEHLPQMVFVKDAERLAFVRFNRAGEELLGIPRASMLGKTDYDFFPAEEAAFFQAKDRQTLAGGAVVDIPEETISTPRGDRVLHTAKVPIPGEDGRPRYLLGISEDITERKAAERALLLAKDEALRTSRELESFSYSVAHDLRAPLRSIDGFSQALLEDYGEHFDETGRKYLRYVRESSQLMAQLIDDLLRLARVTRSELHRERVDLGRLARDLCERLAQRSPERRVQVIIEDDLVADGDPRLLAILLDNLLANAWKFTMKRESARIEVGRSATDQGPAYFVRDNGAGFDMAYAGKLFGVFQRLHSSHEFEGTGVGLATVQRVAHRHGGRVWAEGKVDVGATFWFTLGAEEPRP